MERIGDRRQRSQTPPQPTEARPGLETASKLCITLLPQDTRAAIVQMAQATQWGDCVELRLDAMSSFDLPELLAARPCPVLVTNRPRRQGGSAPDDDEPARLRPLLQAVELGADMVDFELDAAAQVPADHGGTKIILSHHDFHATPADLAGLHRRMIDAGADVCKIAAAGTLSDCLRMLELLAAAGHPTIGLTMGPAGLATRVLARRFAAAAVTYAALTIDQLGGPGQLTARVMRNVYRAHRLDAATKLYGLLAPDAVASALVVPMNNLLRGSDRNAAFLPLACGDDVKPLLAPLARLGFVGLLVADRPARPATVLAHVDGDWQTAARPGQTENAWIETALAAWQST